MTLALLPLEDLSTRHYGLTESIAAAYLEAACVSLDCHHISPQTFVLKRDGNEQKVAVEWSKPDARIKAAWANLDDATRDGAYAFAIASVEHLLSLYAVRRAENRSGSDYYLAPVNGKIDDLEDCIRLEVSGTGLDESELKSRLKIKMEQVRKARNDPAIAIVVGFKVRQILLGFT